MCEPLRRVRRAPSEPSRAVVLKRIPMSLVKAYAGHGGSKAMMVQREGDRPPRDAVGLVIPPELRATFAVVELFEEAEQLHERLAEIVDQIARLPGGVYLRQHLHCLWHS